MAKMKVLEREVAYYSVKEEDYICLTDMHNWNTIEFLGIWDQWNNTEFIPVEFNGIRIQAELYQLTFTPKKWIARTNVFDMKSEDVLQTIRGLI